MQMDSVTSRITFRPIRISMTGRFRIAEISRMDMARPINFMDFQSPIPSLAPDRSVRCRFVQSKGAACEIRFARACQKVTANRTFPKNLAKSEWRCSLAGLGGWLGRLAWAADFFVITQTWDGSGPGRPFVRQHTPDQAVTHPDMGLPRLAQVPFQRKAQRLEQGIGRGIVRIDIGPHPAHRFFLEQM